jgi:hypothetical protein
LYDIEFLAKLRPLSEKSNAAEFQKSSVSRCVAARNAPFYSPWVRKFLPFSARIQNLGLFLTRSAFFSLRIST